MSEHTPGPWKVFGDEIVTDYGDRWALAECYDDPHNGSKKAKDLPSWIFPHSFNFRAASKFESVKKSI